MATSRFHVLKMQTPPNPSSARRIEQQPLGAGLTADYKAVQAHYDMPDGLFALMLDPTRTYSCAYFPSGNETLEEAQRAKIHLALDKLQLQPGQTLLDIGCGWGETLRVACYEYSVKGVGLTLSENQFAYAQSQVGTYRSELEFRKEGWEEYQGRVDAIISIGAFEHFGEAKYEAFFAKAHQMFPPNGLMLLQTIYIDPEKKPTDRTEQREFLTFLRFLGTDIFPNGYLPTPRQIMKHSKNNEFELLQIQPLGPHYAKTLDHWRTNLEQHQQQALQLIDEEKFAIWIGPYLEGAAKWFRHGVMNVGQFLFRAAPIAAIPQTPDTIYI